VLVTISLITVTLNNNHSLTHSYKLLKIWSNTFYDTFPQSNKIRRRYSLLMKCHLTLKINITKPLLLGDQGSLWPSWYGSWNYIYQPTQLVRNRSDKYFHIKSCRIHLATSGNIIYNFSVDMYCRTAILSLFLYMILCLSVMLDSLSCSVISISVSY
jgi:hypothetical protein